MRNALGRVQSLLVLGATSEIALATCRVLAEGGCRHMHFASRGPVAVHDVRGLEQQGVSVSTSHLDVADVRALPGVIDRHFDEFDGDVDLVLLAFGVLGDQRDFDAAPATAADAIDVNFTAAAVAGLQIANRLRQQGHGTLVVLSSVAAERPRPSNLVYGAAKAGLDAFAQGLGDSLVGSGGRVVVVRPGFVHTRMTAGLDPQPFATTPDAVARAIARGLARDDEIVWAPGLLRWVFVVMRHLPRGLWRLVSKR